MQQQSITYNLQFVNLLILHRWLIIPYEELFYDIWAQSLSREEKRR